ncbi:MAG: PspC domain-containing protein [Bacteroidota bacterium]
MKKTVTVNIGGIVFHIDEDAYLLLSTYLESIKAHFHTSEGKDEITSDIEARIGELFTDKLKSGRQVINIDDVNEAIAIMGKPEDFGGEAKTTNSYVNDDKNQWSSGNSKRRVYRNPDDKVLGGVCSGISYYLDLDPLWIRLVFAIMFFGFGSGLLLYIILWVIIPEAKTTAEKLEMKGEKVNVENIEKNIKEEMENLKNKFEDFKNEAKNMGSKAKVNKARGAISSILHAFVEVILFAVNIFVKFFGFIFIIVGIAIFVAIIRLMLGFMGIMPIGNTDLAGMFFNSHGHLFWASIGVTLLIGIPLLMLMYKGFRLIFNIKTKNKTLNAVAASFWIVGLIISSIIFFGFLENYSERSTVKIDSNITQPAGDILYVDMNPKDISDWSHKSYIQFGDIGNFYTENNQIIFRDVELKILKSDNDKFQLIRVQSARGKTNKDAAEAANSINSEVMQKDSLVVLSNFYSIDSKAKYKFQELRYILKVPVGKSVYLANKTRKVLDDIDNVSDTEDKDMVDHKWTMTEKGLKCIDCKGM